MPLKPGTQNTVEKHTGVGGVVSITKDPFAPVVVGRTHLDYETLTINQSSINESSEIVTSTAHGLAEDDVLVYNPEGGTALTTSIGTHAKGDRFYVVYQSADTFKLDNSAAGTGRDITNDGNDNQTFSRPIGKVT